MIDDVQEGSTPGGLDRVQHVGSFRFYFDDRRWEWSDGLAAIHGYQPGEVTPTTDLLAGHKHPEDRHDFEHMVDQMVAHRSPFSSRHRIIDAAGVVRHVVVIGQPIVDNSGTPIGTEGFYLDVDSLQTSDLKDQIDHHINRFRESQGIIEQTKGMIMFAYQVSADQAFEVLKWRSQMTNVKVSALCRTIIDGTRSILVSDANRHAFDQLLLTAHEPVVHDG